MTLRRTATIFFILGAGFVCLPVLLINVLLGHDWDQFREEQRVTSPDGKLDAVGILGLYDGTVGDVGYDVYIVPHGAPAPREGPLKGIRPVLDGRTFYGEKLLWKKTNLLTIGYHHGEIFHFRNRWRLPTKSLESANDIVEIALSPSTAHVVVGPDGEYLL